MHSSDYGQPQYIITVIINYVSEHQLPPVIDASHTTPTTRANRGPQLLKLVGDVVHVLGGSCAYPRPRPRVLALN